MPDADATDPAAVRLPKWRYVDSLHALPGLWGKREEEPNIHRPMARKYTRGKRGIMLIIAGWGSLCEPRRETDQSLIVPSPIVASYDTFNDRVLAMKEIHERSPRMGQVHMDGHEHRHERGGAETRARNHGHGDGYDRGHQGHRPHPHDAVRLPPVLDRATRARFQLGRGVNNVPEAATCCSSSSIACNLRIHAFICVYIVCVCVCV